MNIICREIENLLIQSNQKKFILFDCMLEKLNKLLSNKLSFRPKKLLFFIITNKSLKFEIKS